MYLDSYVTPLVHSRHGSRAPGPGRPKPPGDAGNPHRRPGHRGPAGGAAADRPPRRITPPARAARSGPGRGPPAGPAPRLHPAPAAPRRDRRLAGPVPGPVGTPARCPAHRDSPGETRAKEHQMTGNARPGSRILGSLRAADGKGVVRIEDRYDTDIGDLWSALTDPGRLARWYGEVEGDLRPGGEFRLYLESADMDATGRVEACEPPRRPDHPGHRGPGHAPGQDRLLRGRVADPRRKSRRLPRRA